MSKDKVGLNKWGNPSKTGRDWNEQAGRLGSLPEAERKAISSAGGKKKAENTRKRKEIEALLKDKQALLDSSIADVMEDNPEIVSQVMASLANDAKNGDLKAASVFLEFTGIKAAKQTEVTVKEEMSPEKAAEVLRKALEGK